MVSFNFFLPAEGRRYFAITFNVSFCLDPLSRRGISVEIDIEVRFEIVVGLTPFEILLQIVEFGGVVLLQMVEFGEEILLQMVEFGGEILLQIVVLQIGEFGQI